MSRVASGLPWIAVAIIAGIIIWKVGLDFNTTLITFGLMFLALIGSILIEGERAEPRLLTLRLTGKINEIESKLEVMKKLLEDIRDLLKKISEELSA